MAKEKKESKAKENKKKKEETKMSTQDWYEGPRYIRSCDGRGEASTAHEMDAPLRAGNRQAGIGRECTRSQATRHPPSQSPTHCVHVHVHSMSI